jgi:hypothetical protein
MDAWGNRISPGGLSRSGSGAEVELPGEFIERDRVDCSTERAS